MSIKSSEVVLLVAFNVHKIKDISKAQLLSVLYPEEGGAEKHE